MSGSYDGEKLSFKTAGGGIVIEWEGGVSGDEITGEYRAVATREIGSWTMQRE